MTETYDCPACGEPVEYESATLREPMGDLEVEKWQTLCCPDCGERVKTVFVPLHE